MNSTIRRALLRIAALALPALAVACLSGHDNPAANIGQIIGPDSTGGTSGTSGGNVAGFYRLSTFNGASLPDTVVKVDTLSPDSDRVIIAVLDSAVLQLDTDSTVFENDYFQLTDIRATAGATGPQFNFSTIGGGDPVACAGGTYLDTLETQTTFQMQNLLCATFASTFTVPTVTYTVAGDSLSGSEFYQFYDSAGVVNTPTIPGNVQLVWKFFSSTGAQHRTAAPSGKIMKGRRIILKRD